MPLLRHSRSFSPNDCQRTSASRSPLSLPIYPCCDLAALPDPTATFLLHVFLLKCQCSATFAKQSIDFTKLTAYPPSCLLFMPNSTINIYVFYLLCILSTWEGILCKWSFVWSAEYVVMFLTSVCPPGLGSSFLTFIRLHCL